MGRRRVEMKRIEDRSSRNVTFTKRRRGLFKKAAELSILCEADIALLVFSSSGKLYEFYSHDNSLENVLRRYQQHFGRADAYDDITGKTDGSVRDTWQQSNAEYPRLAQSHLGRLDIEQLNMVELVQLEKQLDAELTKTRSRKIKLMQHSITFCQQEPGMLSQENRLLEEQILMNSNERGNFPHHLPHQATFRWMSKP